MSSLGPKRAGALGRSGDAKKKGGGKARTSVGAARLHEQAAQSFLAEATVAKDLEHHLLLGRPRFCLAEADHVLSGHGCHQIAARLAAEGRVLPGQGAGSCRGAWYSMKGRARVRSRGPNQ